MRLISRAEMARIAGVSKPAITKACGKQLEPACQGERVDLDHAAAIAYLRKRGVTPPPARPVRSNPPPDGAPTDPPKRRRAAPPEPTDSPEPRRRRGPKPTEDDAEEVGHMRPPPGINEGSPQDLKQLTDALLPLVERFGTDTRFNDWLDALKNIELIREKRLKNGETEGGYISRELVKTHMIGAVDGANKRLLGDASKTIASKVFNIARSGGGLEEAQRAVREEQSKHLKWVKEKIVRALRHKTDGPKK